MSLAILFHFLRTQHVSDINLLGLLCAVCFVFCTISSTQQTKNKTTDVVIQQHSRKLVMMDILMSETCLVHKK